MALFRHGDVLISSTDRVPETATPRLGNVLVRGELTGHSHRFEPSTSAEFFSDGAFLFLDVRDTVDLVHQEHDTIELMPGIYKIWRQREYTPEIVRPVID